MALSLFNTTVQLHAALGRRPLRALSLYQTTTFGGIAAGSWIWGTTADTHGAEAALLASAVAMLAGAALGLRYGLPELESLNVDPLGRFSEPDLPLDLKPRSGSIVVLIDYEIAEDDIPEFLETMTERRASATARASGR